jgi:hypothetical protein
MMQRAKATASDTLGRMSEEAIVNSFQLLSKHLLAEIEEDH